MICKELNKSFEDKKTLFKELKENEKTIIAQKKLEIKSFEKGLKVVSNQKQISKALQDETIKGIKFDDNYYYFVVNSANILDSHNDMHVEGNWNKTVKEQQGRVYLVWEHQLSKENIIAFPEDIVLMTAKIPFSVLGKNYDGETYSLIYKIAKDKIIDKTAKEWLEDGRSLQASVRMQYVKIEPAFNSKDFPKEKETFDTYYPLIANKEEHNEIDYFWVVKEAKNVMESSLVLFGSNSATGRIDNKEEQGKTTLNDIIVEQVEVVTPTQKRKRSVI